MSREIKDAMDMESRWLAYLSVRQPFTVLPGRSYEPYGLTRQLFCCNLEGDLTPEISFYRLVATNPVLVARGVTDSVTEALMNNAA